MLTVELGNKVYKVRFYHLITDRKTICEVYVNNAKFAMGVAFTHPKDRYNRKIGRKIAFGRAISVFGKDKRTKLWEAYLKTYGVYHC